MGQKSYKDGMGFSVNVDALMKDVNAFDGKTPPKEILILYKRTMDQVTKATSGEGPIGPSDMSALQGCFWVLTGALKVQNDQTRTSALMIVQEAAQKMHAKGNSQFGEYFKDVAHSFLAP